MDIRNLAQSLPIAGCQSGKETTAARASGQGQFARLLAGTREQSPESAAAQQQDLLRQLADWDSDFYRDMRASLRLKLEESEEEQKEQAVIDALSGLIDAMNAPKDRRTPVALSTASIANAAGTYEPDDPRRTQLELFMRRLNDLGIYLDLDAVSGGGESGEDWKSLTRLLMEREAKEPARQTTL